MFLDQQAVLARLAPRHGKAAARWAETLSDRLDALVAAWGLDIGEELPSGNSLLLGCTAPEGPAVLKLSPDGFALAEQTEMLRLLAPSGRVPEVIASAKGALLMAAVSPGTVIETMPAPPSPEEYALFLSDLHGAGDPGRAPRKLADWMQVYFTTAERLGADLTRSRALFDELSSSVAERDVVLLHGDLHFGNVLIGGPRGLVAVGLRAAVGDRYFDAVDYVLEAFSVAEMHRRRDALAEAAGLDPRRLDAWCHVVAPIPASYVLDPTHKAALTAFARGEG